MVSSITSEIAQAIVLGVVQGLTEFLPVSSSGHLEIAKYLMGNNDVGKQSMMMTVVLHFATALSTVVVFRREIVEIFRGLFSSKTKEEFTFCCKIVLSMFPAAFVGVLLESEIESLFAGRLFLVGSMLILTGILLILADRAKVTDKAVSFFDAVIVGIAQAIAILPGISRSGATISTSVLLGIDRTKAARFSFLMVVPLIFGKMGFDVLKSIMKNEPLMSASETLPLIIGFCFAFFTGVIACTWMIQLVKSCQLFWFSIYCFIVAALVIAESFLGFLR